MPLVIVEECDFSAWPVPLWRHLGTLLQLRCWIWHSNAWWSGVRHCSSSRRALLVAGGPLGHVFFLWHWSWWLVWLSEWLWANMVSTFGEMFPGTLALFVLSPSVVWWHLPCWCWGSPWQDRGWYLWIECTLFFAEDGDVLLVCFFALPSLLKWC